MLPSCPREGGRSVALPSRDPEVLEHSLSHPLVLILNLLQASLTGIGWGGSQSLSATTPSHSPGPSAGPADPAAKPSPAPTSPGGCSTEETPKRLGLCGPRQRVGGEPWPGGALSREGAVFEEKEGRSGGRQGDLELSSFKPGSCLFLSLGRGLRWEPVHKAGGKGSWRQARERGDWEAAAGGPEAGTR